jgi:hypothetical protein
MKLTDQELSELQDVQREYQRKKVILGDIEVRKSEVVDDIKALKKAFAIMEKKFIERYGEDSVIDMQTGEVKKNEQD